MKKLLLILLLSFTSLVSFGATNDTTLTYQNVKKDLTELVHNLQGPAKHVYDVYVHQHVISGLVFFWASIGLLVVSLCVFIWAIRTNSSTTKNQMDEISFGTGVVSGIALALSIMMLLIFFCGNSYAEIVNPEYYAIQDIANLIKP